MENQLWAYVIAITLLTITPGVDTMLIIRNTTRGGWRDGAVSSLGICSGLFVHASVSAVGISVILLHSALAFSALKLAGAGYLIWLGITSLRHALTGMRHWEAEIHTSPAYAFSTRRSLLEGFLSNVLNPKAVIFYMAFLPQFIDPARSALLRSLFLAGLHFTIAMIWQCFLAGIVDQAKQLLSHPMTHRVLDALSGSIIMLLGIMLAVDR